MSSGSHLSKELFELVKSIGESRSKQEEDKIITQELSTLKAKIAEPSIPPKKMKEYLVRAIYIEMLGHDASFAYIHAINLTRSTSVQAKRIGYMTCALSLPQDSQLLILLVATLQTDLKSSNYLEASGALSAILKLVNSGMVHSLSDSVVKLVSSPNEIIRKKAIMALMKFTKLNPSLMNEYDVHFRKALCDKDPSVMGASLNYFWDMLQEERLRPYYKDLIPSFVVILKQIIDHRLPRDYDYHRMPAPWLQIKILEILGLLGQDDQRASEQMYEILSDVMRRADDTGINAGYAIVYQCLKTTTTIYPNSGLIENAAHCISRFLTSENHNLKYTGITGLISIVKINPTYASRHQMVVVDCLEDTDDTLKKKTLNLLFKMTNPNNIRIIIEKLMNFLRSATFDPHLKEELATKISDVAERFAPDSKWYLHTMNTVLELAGEHVKPSIVNNLVRLVDEWREDPDIVKYTAEEYLKILEGSSNIQDPMMRTAAWVLGEFGDYLDSEKQEKIMKVLCKALSRQFENPLTKGWVLTALLKSGKGIPSDEVRELVSRFSASRNEDLQQRCYEFAGICTKLSHPVSFKENQGLSIDFELSFLDNYVQEQIMQGARTYDQERNRRGISYIISKSKDSGKSSQPFEGLKTEPYAAPVVENPAPFLVSTPQEAQVASGLQVKQKVWSKQGYIGQMPAKEPKPAPPAPVPTSNPSAQRSYAPRQKTQKEIEKEKFAASLFGGLSEEPPVTQQEPKPKTQDQGSLLDLI